jgi:zeta-carotene desaturase
LLGCCTNLVDFFGRVGAGNQFRYFNQYRFHDRGSVSTLSASALPAPLHLLPSLAGFRSFTRRDRWAIARAMLAILRTSQPFPDEPLTAWLDRHRQSAAVKENFWKVILVSALNEDLERLSTRAAFHVFMDSFLRNRRGYWMGVPTVSLGELYSSRRLNEKCTLRLTTPVSGFETEGDRVRSLRLQNGGAASADYYLSTLPPDALVNTLTEEQRRAWPATRAWEEFGWSPITGVHLWFDRRVMEGDYLTVCGKTIQWIFNKSALGESRRLNDGTQYIQVVVSASRSLMLQKREDILNLVLGELSEILPRLKEATLKKSVVVKETKATSSFLPGTDNTRPGPETPFGNLFLAGDWTQTGWPPTMEGAVRSGYRAAERITAAAGQPKRFLISDLPTAPLASLLLRS